MKVEPATKQPVEPQPIEPNLRPSREAATTNTTPTTTASAQTGTFRGRVIDATTRQPVPEFEVGRAGVIEDRMATSRGTDFPDHRRSLRVATGTGG